MIKLQLALDDISLKDALSLLGKVRDHIDIAEVGTPFLMEYGTSAIRQIKAAFPGLEVLCDGKIMDAGSYEADIGFEAGADYVTVLAVTEDATIRDVALSAERRGKIAVADMICVRDLPQRVSELKQLGIQMLSVHTGVDQQKAGRTPISDLSLIKSCCGELPVSVAGGITPDTVDEYLALDPAVIICGGGILHAADPAAATAELSGRIRCYNRLRGF